MERLQKIIANAGFCSRRKAEEYILAGKVIVNGKVIKELGFKCNQSDDITIDKKHLTIQQKEYYMLNKPRGYICSVMDPENRKLVVDLIDTKVRIYPVGRLDYDTTGLIILTNDGELTNKLTHPSFEIEKKYIVKLNKILSMEDYFKIKDGIIIDDRKVNVSRIKIKEKDSKKNTSIVEITINEGRNHIIKRLFEYLHYDVVKLNRHGYGILELGNLKSGEYRMLSDEEIDALYVLGENRNGNTRKVK